jgi:hypothetical protein
MAGALCDGASVSHACPAVLMAVIWFLSWWSGPPGAWIQSWQAAQTISGSNESGQRRQSGPFCSAATRRSYA